MSNEQPTQWIVSAVCLSNGGAEMRLVTSFVSRGEAEGLATARDAVTPVCVRHLRDMLPSVVDTARAEGFAAGLTRARDLLAAQASESEALARGQAAEAEQVQKRAAASATRAAVQRAQVATLDREIAALKGGA